MSKILIDEATVKLVLEALDVLLTEPIAHKAADRAEYLLFQAAPAIREALAEQPAQTDWEAVAADQALTIALLKAEQPAQQEPVGWITQARCLVDAREFTEAEAKLYGWTPLYTSPQPAQQEPPTVAELLCVCGAEWEWRNRDWELVATPPAQRKPLTDEQIEKCFAESDGTFVSAGRAIEAAHGIKENT